MKRFVLAAITLGFASLASAAIPERISFQGVVLDGVGDPVPGPVNMLFSLYADSTGGAALWSETQNGVTLTGGVFDVELGSVTPFALSFDTPYWIELESPPGNILGPRKPLLASPYALNAAAVGDGAAVRSLNGLTDDLDIVAGANITVTPVGDSSLVIAGSGAGADADWLVKGGDMSSIPSGDVGIGTATPSDKLHLYSAEQFGTTLRVQDAGTNGTLGAAIIDLEAMNTTGRIQVLETLTRSFGLSTLDDSTGMFMNAHEEITFRPANTIRMQLETDGTADFRNSGGTTTVEIDPANTGGRLLVTNESGLPRFDLEGSEAGSSTDGAQMSLYSDADNATFVVDADWGSTDSANLSMYNSLGNQTIEMRAQENATATNGASIFLRDDQGNTTIELDADFGTSGKGRIITEVLEITGGSDLSEQFDIDASGVTLEPGMVVVIDAARPGGLAVSTRAYDRRVAGVVSGAGGVNPGMLMGQRGSAADGQHPVALTGRVYVMADASSATIEPGDLLTTSDVPGHAMKASARDRSQGAILGKAMTGLEGGTGMILMLVTLQ